MNSHCHDPAIQRCDQARRAGLGGRLDAYALKHAPEGAPNVLVILYDDTGLASWSPYGGRINMPTLDRLADNGLTYTQWHTTALCSPTRSDVPDGTQPPCQPVRIDHRGLDGLPGRRGAAARRVRDHRTGAAGQRLQHATGSARTTTCPVEDISACGSRSEWPLSKGFDRFYGFLGGETNQWYPGPRRRQPLHRAALHPRRGLPPVQRPCRPSAQDAARPERSSAPSKPWFMWFCPGANHAPHHAPQEYIDKYKGMFDDGYEAYREWVLRADDRAGRHAGGHRADAAEPDARRRGQRRPTTCGRGPSSTTTRRSCSAGWPRCSPGSPSTPTRRSAASSSSWSSTGQLDNTLIFYCADNGASGEGTPNGSVNENKFFNGYPDSLEENMSLPRRARRPRRLQPLPHRLGGGVLHAVPDVQALFAVRRAAPAIR